MIWMAVALGGALGSLARHSVNLAFGRLGDGSAAWATAAVNVSGSLVAGILAGLIAAERVQMSPVLRTFVFVGILGGFTTFSSFMLEAFTAGHGRNHALAFWNVVTQTGLGLLAVSVGYYLASGSRA